MIIIDPSWSFLQPTVPGQASLKPHLQAGFDVHFSVPSIGARFAPGADGPAEECGIRWIGHKAQTS